MTLPLLPEAAPDAIVALHGHETIRRDRFVRELCALAARLPAGRPLLNLCGDRYHFALGLFAGIVQGNLSLLPNSTAEGNLAALQADYPDLVCLTDDAHSAGALPALRLDTLLAALPADAATPAMPQIPAQQRVACVFTSGSTGRPQPHFKTFGKLVRNVRAQARRTWSTTGGPCAVLGTVPFQHMYGLESTVLLPVLGGGILCAPRPYYPADVAEQLARLPEPRFLVTTPYHLRNLLASGIAIAPVAGLLSATAPLANELARHAEARLQAPLLEIYGSTETGQIATRRPALEDLWLLHDDIRLACEGDDCFVDGGHLEARLRLGDVVEPVADGRFRLLGRHADLINVAGKRSSLGFLNHMLLRLPGVRDACFCLPREGETARLAAFVVAPGLSAATILAGLRQQVDAVFLPRPLVFVDQLPRNATGKIPAAELEALIARHITRKP